MRQPYKVVILCGGRGMRLLGRAGEEPKALAPIGDRPILWHVMKRYSHFGFRDFVLALGYKGERIVDYFDRYCLRHCDVTVAFSDPLHRVYHTALDDDERDWTVTFVHTGLDTMTGGRLKRVAAYIAEDTFLATYTDGLADIDLAGVFAFHRRSALRATMVSVHLPTAFGLIEARNGVATRFREKPIAADRINGGFFVFHRSILDTIEGDDTVLEEEPLQSLVEHGAVGVYEHEGFWHCLDTPKDAEYLNALWSAGRAPWLRWETRS
jgi:glucose-1-phosphate cytidylyltransferase